ncbi:ECF transporter S component [Agromyces sp. LHK192]|uniref:ECF transporter S component n=1 Tax=Agromyces sp. LHK192 TaxID=2498704 RepID=UPI000FDB8A5F|nr:ECF transporter S component [Agromyces sp. LHK192]
MSWVDMSDVGGRRGEGEAAEWSIVTEPEPTTPAPAAGSEPAVGSAPTAHTASSDPAANSRTSAAPRSRIASPYSTSYLLTAAAIAAATAILLIAGNWIGYATSAIPWMNGVTLGLWVVPWALALRLLPLPGTTLLVALFAGIVMGPFQPDGFRAIYVNLWYAFFFEIVFAVTLYRIQRLWLCIVGGVLNGAVWGVTVALALDAASMVPGVVAATILIPTISGGVGGWLGFVIADALIRRGVGTTTRKRLDQRRAARAAARAASGAPTA